MPTTVAARFSAEGEAERALSTISSKVALVDSAVVNNGLRGSLTLDSLDLTQDERSACEAQLKRGGFLLVAQTADPAAADEVLRLLDDTGGGREPQIMDEGSHPPPAAVAPTVPAAPEPVPATPIGTTAAPLADKAVEEERIPLVEEELRIGKREVVSGGARIRSFTTEVPVQEQVELLHEETSITRRPVNRRLTEDEVLEGGLLKERVIEVTQMREEAVVTKEAFVREEVIVTKTIERRIEQINETVRRTEIETQEIEPGDRSVFGSFGAAGDDRQR
jgi:uncharacterized protein (TIGR02271 family)